MIVLERISQRSNYYELRVWAIINEIHKSCFVKDSFDVITMFNNLVKDVRRNGAFTVDQLYEAKLVNNTVEIRHLRVVKDGYRTLARFNFVEVDN